MSYDPALQRVEQLSRSPPLSTRQNLETPRNRARVVECGIVETVEGRIRQLSHKVLLVEAK